MGDLRSSQTIPGASRILKSPSNAIFVSAASIWEIATKVRLGKLPEADEIEKDLLTVIEDEAGFTLLSVEPADSIGATGAGRFASAHGDPFDRMIAAQALMEDIPVISSDTKLDSFGVHRIW